MTKDQEFHQRVRFQYLYCVANKALTRSRKKARALRREVKELRGELNRELEVNRKHRILQAEYEEHCKRYHARLDTHERQRALIVELINATYAFNPSESLYANVAAALARANVKR